MNERVPVPNHRWTEEESALVCQLWKEGMPTASIMLRFSWCTSRSTIIGKINRMGLGRQRRPKPTVRLRPPEQRRPKKTSEAVAEKEPQRLPKRHLWNHCKHVEPRRIAPRKPVVDSGNRGVALLDLQAHGCRYAVNDKSPYRFCNSPGFPWCPEHRAIVEQPRLRMKVQEAAE